MEPTGRIPLRVVASPTRRQGTADWERPQPPDALVTDIVLTGPLDARIIATFIANVPMPPGELWETFHTKGPTQGQASLALTTLDPLDGHAILLRDRATFRDFVSYFGEEPPADQPLVAYPFPQIGDYFNPDLLDLGRLILEMYGARDTADRGLSVVQKVKYRLLREDAVRSLNNGTLTPRLRTHILTRDEWNINDLIKQLMLDAASVGRLLRHVGYVTTFDKPTRWHRVRRDQ